MTIINFRYDLYSIFVWRQPTSFCFFLCRSQLSFHLHLHSCKEFSICSVEWLENKQRTTMRELVQTWHIIPGPLVS